MNERAYKAKLRRLLKPHVYIQSITSLGVGGTPDLWLSWPGGDLWLEVKYDPHTLNSVKPKLSALQLKWLNGRYAEGRNAAVLVGTSPSEGILFTHRSWEGRSNERRPLSELITIMIGK